MFMKRVTVFLFVLAMAVTVAVGAYAEGNSSAFFMIDTNLGSPGFDSGGTTLIENIGGGADIAFAVYIKNVDDLRGAAIEVTYDSAKLEIRTRDTGTEIIGDEFDVNGENVDVADEANFLGSVTSAPGFPLDGIGMYSDKYTILGGDALVSNQYGLIYFVYMRTLSGFTTSDMAVVTVKAQAANSSGQLKDMGTRQVFVNQIVDVQKSTWGEVKTKFKD